jgi:hypothetical protein
MTTLQDRKFNKKIQSSTFYTQFSLFGAVATIYNKNQKQLFSYQCIKNTCITSLPHGLKEATRLQNSHSTKSKFFVFSCNLTLNSRESSAFHLKIYC